MHMNGRRSTRPSGNVSGERDCKPAGFVLSTPSGEGAAGDGGFLPKLSRRRFPSPFSLSRICSMRSGPARRVRLWRQLEAGPSGRVDNVLLYYTDEQILPKKTSGNLPLSASHTRQAGVQALGESVRESVLA